MNYENEDVEVIINNEYDYSNAIVSVENITYIVQYCNNVYNQFLKLMENDELKNERLKYEFKNYEFKKTYSNDFEVIIMQKPYNNISYKNYDLFIDAINNGQINNIVSLNIKLVLDYSRGSNGNLNEHKNSFNIKFQPYEIKFIRKSNHNENNMNQIENNINEMLKRFPVANTIFCTK